MTWPDDGFLALKPGPAKMGEQDVTLSVVDCGLLTMPSGRLVCCDPFVYLDARDNPWVQVPPGAHPVRITLADVSQAQDGSHVREAYATLVVGPGAEVRRRHLAPTPRGHVPQDLDPGEFSGFGVDAGTACFVDAAAVESSMPDASTWYGELFENGRSDSWFARMDDPNHLRPGIANIALPLARNGENLVLFHSGWGDGVYPIIGGYDAEDHLVAVHIDFFVLGTED